MTPTPPKPGAPIGPIVGDTSSESVDTTINDGETPIALEPTSSQGSRFSSVSNAPSDDRLTRILTGNMRPFHTALPPMGAGKPYPAELPPREPYRVEFDGSEDPSHPLNWPTKTKVISIGVMAYATMISAWGSSIISVAQPEIMHKFHLGTTPAALTVSLYVLGFALGPIVWGPISELYGRKPVMLIAYGMFVAFSFAAGTAKDVQTLMLCRFFSGATSACPLVVVAACFADMLGAKQRGIASAIFSFAVSGGPCLSPVVGSYIVTSHLGWRWLQYITGIMAALAMVLLVFFMKESYAPIILTHKARELRLRTHNWGIYAQHETVELNFEEIFEQSLRRPIVMLFCEPILLLLSLYNGFVYGIIYMCLGALPIIFMGYGFPRHNLMLPYLGILLGIAISTAVTILVFEPMFYRDLKKSGKPVLPEARLYPMMAGGIFFCVGIFWLCWTGAYPNHVHWIVPTIGGAFLGFGFIGLFLSIINYIIDTYLYLAASALAANTLLRSGMGAAFPLFTHQMFINLKIQWAGTLVGCLAFVMLPIPFLFYIYGARIRKFSKYAMDYEELMRQRLAAAAATEHKKEV